MKNFQHIVNAAPVAILLADQAGRITFANTATGQLFGYASEELVGQSVELLMAADNLKII